MNNLGLVPERRDSMVTKSPSKQKLTFFEHFVRQPPHIMDHIVKCLSSQDVLRIEEAVPELHNILFDYHHLLTYKPQKIVVEDEKIVFEADEEQLQMSDENFSYNNFRVVSQMLIIKDDLTDDLLEKMSILFQNRVRVTDLSMYIFKCNLQKCAEFIEVKFNILPYVELQRIGATTLYIHSDLNSAFWNHAFMKQIKILIVGPFLTSSSDFVFKNNFRRLQVKFDNESSVSLNSLHNVLLDWVNKKREVDNWEIQGIGDWIDNIYILFDGWKIIEDDELEEERNSPKPLVVSLPYHNDEVVYKLVRNDENELFIHLHGDTIALSKERPVEYDSELEDDLLQYLYDEFDGDISLNSENCGEDEYWNDDDYEDYEDFL